ncbi:MAG: hypothetical protein QXF12_06235 [Candidatus Aenigmatarchaeota archaeon]
MQFNFFISFIIFSIVLLPLFIFLLYRLRTYTIFKEHQVISSISISLTLLLLLVIILILIISSTISIVQGRLHMLYIIAIASTVSFLLITSFINISSNLRLKIYLSMVSIIVVTYTLTVSAINDFYPYYRDNVRDTLAVSRIIESGFIYEAQELLKNTERYYSILPIFQLLLVYLTSLTGDINSAYLLIGTIQLIGIILGTFVLLKAICKYNIVGNIYNKNIYHNKIYNKYLIHSIPFIGSLLIIGLPYGFFAITATQPQSISLSLAVIILYLLINLVNKISKSIIIIFTILIAVANIYHVIMSIVLFIFTIGYVIYSYNKRDYNGKKITTSYILSIIIFASLLITIYWYEPSSILRINVQANRILNALQTTSITTAVTTSGEYLSEGFKFYAYSFAFLLIPLIGLLCIWTLDKMKIVTIHNKSIFSSFNIFFTILIITFITLAFISVMANPSQTGGLGRYLLGQGAIFILSLIVVSSILANIMLVDRKAKALLLCLLFIYTLSGLTQFYWTPDYTVTVYASHPNLVNINTFYSKINSELDILYLHGSIYIPPESDNYSLQQYKLRTLYPAVKTKLFTHISDNDLQFYLLKHHNIGHNQSFLIFITEEVDKNKLTYSDAFNRIFTSNRYSVFSTSLIMV